MSITNIAQMKSRQFDQEPAPPYNYLIYNDSRSFAVGNHIISSYFSVCGAKYFSTQSTGTVILCTLRLNGRQLVSISLLCLELDFSQNRFFFLFPPYVA